MTDPVSLLRNARRIVIKIGSAQLIDWRTGQAHMGRFCALGCEIAGLRKHGVEVVLVSSGSGAIRQSPPRQTATKVAAPRDPRSSRLLKFPNTSLHS